MGSLACKRRVANERSSPDVCKNSKQAPPHLLDERVGLSFHGHEVPLLHAVQLLAHPAQHADGQLVLVLRPLLPGRLSGQDIGGPINGASSTTLDAPVGIRTTYSIAIRLTALSPPPWSPGLLQSHGPVVQRVVDQHLQDGHEGGLA